MMNLSILNLETGECLALSKVQGFYLERHPLFKDSIYRDEMIFANSNLLCVMGEPPSETIDQSTCDELFSLISFLMASLGQPIVLMNDYSRDVTLEEIMEEVGVNPSDVHYSGSRLRSGATDFLEFIERRKDRLIWDDRSRVWFESNNLTRLARDCIRKLFRRKLLKEDRKILHEVSPTDYTSEEEV